MTQTGLDRRGFLRRTVVGSGAVGALWLAPGLVREALGDPVPMPHEARAFEAGLAAFAAKWQAAGPVVELTRFGRFLTNKVFNCQVAGQPRVYSLRLGIAGAVLSPGPDPFRHADLVMPEADWLGVLYGDYTGMAPLLDGTFFPSKDTADMAALLVIVMYVAAYIPVGADPDPQLFISVVQGLFTNGVPSCPGGPAELETYDALRNDPDGTVRRMLLPTSTAPPVTKLLTEWVAGLRYEQLPSGTVVNAKKQLLGILASIYAGSRMPPGRRFTAAVRSLGDRPEAAAVGADGFRTSARHAALLNSVHAQVLEWEDWTYLAHSGASLVPAALAAGELGDASGRDLLTAIVAGNEILARAGEVLTDAIGTGNAVPIHQIDATLVAGHMLRLSATTMADALGIACAQPQLTSIAAWTADAKGLLTGWPVLTGVEATQLARAGVHGRRDILENPLGYCYRVSDIPDPSRFAVMVDGLGHDWRFDAARHELVVKRFPTDGFQLTTVQGVLDIVNRQARAVWDGTPRGRLPDVIRRVEARVPLVMAGSGTMFSKGGKDIYRRIHDRPDWSYIALLFDAIYPVAAALANRRLTFHEYDESVIFDPVVQHLVDVVDLVPDVTMGALGAHVTVELADGRSFESFQPCITEFPVVEKLRLAAEGLLPPQRVAEIAAVVDHLEMISVRDLVRTVAINRGDR